MKEIKFGLFGMGYDEIKQLNPTSLIKLSSTENCSNPDCFEDQDYDLDRNEMKNLSVLGKFNASKLQRTVPIPSLYGYCDVFSNDAVTSSTPLSKMKSSSYPFEVEYSS